MKRSRTKIGAVLAGIGVIFGTAAAYCLGEIGLAKAIAAIITEIGVVVGIFGIRGWPILNGGRR